MNFEGTQSTIQVLKERKIIYAEEMTGLFLDICRDIQSEMEIAPAKLPVGDAEEAALRLCQMGNMYRYILERQKDVLFSTQKKEQLQQLDQTIAQQVKKLKSIQKEIERYSKKKGELESEERELQEKFSEASEKVQQAEKEVQDLEKKYNLRIEEQKKLEEKAIKLQKSIEETDFEQEADFIEEARQYAEKMVGAWNAASKRIGILKQEKDLMDLREEMDRRRVHMEAEIENYRKQIECVIRMMEEAWEEQQ